MVGNSRYQKVPATPKAVNDARAMQFVLQKLGFEVTYGEDLRANEISTVVSKFISDERRNKVGLFYYAGHGAQILSENYMVPVDASFSSEADLRAHLISIRQIVKYTNDASDNGLIILDSCRDNPFRGELETGAARGAFQLSRGLGPRVYDKVTDASTQAGGNNDPSRQPIGMGMADMTADTTGGMLFAYATSPGSIARDGSGEHSPFTEGLLRYIEEPIEIRDVMTFVRRHVFETTNHKQLPWDSSSLREQVFLAGRGTLPVLP